ncbi:hypothetical protein O6H91_15G028500 [Diphasiastrum complanatum]|uniref:Uncharacterized protein n=1 Tax=Diphasiastrum complanatum TaxID=34168 RepID=A0ACC2BGQ6_DIPCM|nr:hypothetical protein O6H91_15G028500 [Diphasiastrum complanatum]
MPSLPTFPSSHASLQFLNSVLSQRGPNPLPYQEDLKWHVRQHLLTLIQEFAGLQLKTAIFTHNDGRAVNLLQAHGTIPMLYKEVSYNIPVTLWLLESYPRNPPLIYVTPTRDMIIKPRHRFVDASGLVSAPFLDQWIFPRCNLVELVQNLSSVFGQDPPLYSRPASPRPPHPSRQGTNAAGSLGLRNPTTNSNTTLAPSSRGASPLGTPLSPKQYSPSPQRVNQIENASPRPYPPSPQRLKRTDNPSPRPYPPSPHRSNQTDNPSEVFKRNAINYLMDHLRKDMLGLRKSFELEIDELFTMQALLNQRSEQLEQGFSNFKQEKEGLEQQVQLVLKNADTLETWLETNDKDTKQVDIDDVFQPSDALSKQMLECRASDLAIEDSLYSLDKAVQDGAIPVEAYLKYVRTLSREQFFFRATTLKVRAAQLHIQAFGMASNA